MPDRPALSGDYLYQLQYVGDAARRLLAMQDGDALSPSFGSFHYPYWRDKTSEFADARFQEAGAALGLLAHPAFREIGRDRGWPGPEELLRAYRAGLANLRRLQYAEGSYDEWYKGERGFAATTFTTFAYAAAAIELGDVLPADIHGLLRETLAPAARWLLGREDLVKVNHEVVAAAALATYGTLCSDAPSLAGARDKLARSLATQTEEGWFPELRGMDFGYSALVVDYLGHYGRLVGMDQVVAPVGRLVNFLLPHFHPDLTLSAEGGTCRNPYAGQAGYVLFAPHIEGAAAVAGRLAALGPEASRARILAYLADDLRLARWSILPLLGALAFQRMPDVSAAAPLSVAQGWTVNARAGVAAFHSGSLHIHVPYAGGPVTRVFHGDRLVLADLGVDGEAHGASVTSMTYDADRKASTTSDGMTARFELAPAGYFYPSFLQRLVLRLGSTTSWSSRRLREAIDWYRQRKRTAINQSGTSVGKGGHDIGLERNIEIAEGRVTISDWIDSTGLRIRLRLAGSGLAAGAGDEIAAAGPMTVRKVVDLASGQVEVETA
jgi:hypothetical protein